jgi:hypothetical protein
VTRSLAAWIYLWRGDLSPMWLSTVSEVARGEGAVEEVNAIASREVKSQRKDGGRNGRCDVVVLCRFLAM